MHNPKITLMPSLITLLAMCCSGLAADYGAAGDSAVQVITDTWKDTRRNRDIPVRIYLPKGSTRAPVIIFSHGLWGNNEHYEYIGRQWASRGYISVHVQHPGTDTDALKARFTQNNTSDGTSRTKPGNRMRDKLPTNPMDPTIIEGMHERPADITFAIDQVLALDKSVSSVLKGRVDADKIGVAGHSFGGYTALAVAGEQMPGLKSFADPRVKAIIAMSPPANNAEKVRTDAITIPVLVMTGTLDDTGALGGTPAQRSTLFDRLAHAERYLCMFEGGDHMIYPGGDRNQRLGQMRGSKGDPAKDADFQAVIKASSTAFWDAYLRGDAAAKSWLQGDGAKNALGKDGKWNYKAAK